MAPHGHPVASEQFAADGLGWRVSAAADVLGVAPVRGPAAVHAGDLHGPVVAAPAVADEEHVGLEQAVTFEAHGLPDRGVPCGEAELGPAEHERVDEWCPDDVLYDVGEAGSDEQFAHGFDELGVFVVVRVLRDAVRLARG